MLSPAFKYFYGRLGLFVVVFVLLMPTPLNLLIKMMVALLVSAVAGYFLLAKWRNQMGEQLSAAAQRRTTEKMRLRAALAGDEEAAAAGDRVAAAAPRNPEAAPQPTATADHATTDHATADHATADHATTEVAADNAEAPAGKRASFAQKKK
jgi:hypothetical protein